MTMIKINYLFYKLIAKKTKMLARKTNKIAKKHEKPHFWMSLSIGLIGRFSEKVHGASSEICVSLGQKGGQKQGFLGV